MYQRAPTSFPYTTSLDSQNHLLKIMNKKLLCSLAISINITALLVLVSWVKQFVSTSSSSSSSSPSSSPSSSLYSFRNHVSCLLLDSSECAQEKEFKSQTPSIIEQGYQNKKGKDNKIRCITLEISSKEIILLKTYTY